MFDLFLLFVNLIKHMTSDSKTETALCATNLENNVAANVVEQIDNTIYVYDIPTDEYINVCYFLHKNNLWIEAARQMGYSDMDIVVSTIL